MARYKTESEEFALAMVWACLPRVCRLTFNGREWMHVCIEAGDSRTRTGDLLIHMEGLKPGISVSYKAKGLGDGKNWTAGECTITFTDNPNQSWEFYCERKPLAVQPYRVEVTPMSEIRLQAELRKLVEHALRRLGNNADAVGRRLTQLGLDPNVRGLETLLSRLFNVVSIWTQVAALEGTSYEVFVCRSDGEMPTSIGQLPKGVHELLGRID